MARYPSVGIGARRRVVELLGTAFGLSLEMHDVDDFHTNKIRKKTIICEYGYQIMKLFTTYSEIARNLKLIWLSI